MAMALRSIGNTLPVIPDRASKKTVKVNVPIQRRKSGDFALNDENVNPVLPPSSMDVSVDYVASEDLESFPDPESELEVVISGLESADWIKVCESLNNVRRFAVHHSSSLFPVLEKVIAVMVKSIKNPRSALCKTSIMASADIFRGFGNKLLELTPGVFDSMLLQLLLKASQDKRFVSEEADRALAAMAEFISPLQLLHRIKAYVTHQNLRIRAKAAMAVSNCVSSMGFQGLEEFGLILLLQMIADLLNDRLPEAREASRNIVFFVRQAYIASNNQGNKSWPDFCHSNLSSFQALTLLKITATP